MVQDVDDDVRACNIFFLFYIAKHMEEGSKYVYFCDFKMMYYKPYNILSYHYEYYIK